MSTVVAGKESAGTLGDAVDEAEAPAVAFESSKVGAEVESAGAACEGEEDEPAKGNDDDVAGLL